MITVTGATGNIGSLLSPKLKATGKPVRLVTRDPSKLDSLKGDNVEVVEGSLADSASITRAVDGAERLVIICAPDPQGGQWEMDAVDAAKASGVKHVVMVSALGASADSPIVLAQNHHKAEEHLKASGVGYTIIQPHYFFQNLYLSMPTIQGEGKVYNCQGDGKISAIDADDIAEVLTKILTEDGHAGKTYMLTGPEALDFATMCKKLGDAAGRSIEHVNIPEEAYAGALKQAQLPDWLADDLAKMAAVFGMGVAADVSPHVEEILGRPPRSFDNFARDHAPAFKGG